MKVIKEDGEKKIAEANKRVEQAQEAFKNASKKADEIQANVTFNAAKLQQDDDLHNKNQKTLKYMTNAKKLSAEMFNETKTQQNTSTAQNGTNTTNATLTEVKPPATHALLEADKDIVI